MKAYFNDSKEPAIWYIEEAIEHKNMQTLLE